MIRFILPLLFCLFTSASQAQVGPSTGGSVYGSGLNVINAGVGYGLSATAADNATALQAAINAAVAQNKALYIPAASTCYKYAAPLTISGNLSVFGDYVAANSNGNPNVPTGSPILLGSVICPSSNGSDAIDISGVGLSVNFTNIGIQFQTAFSGTGDGIHYIPTSTNQGLTGAQWQNVMVYGHDGNHYAFNLQNLITNTMIHTYSWGGGVYNLFGTGSINMGNTVFVDAYGQTIVGGTANGFNITASGPQLLNLMTFIRPQGFVNNVAGVSPGGNLPTSAQDIWHEDANVQNIRKIAPDWETNVSANVTLGSPAVGNDADWNSLFTTAATIKAPAWLTNGIMLGPQTRTFTDTTSTGTITHSAAFGMPGWTFKASNAITATNVETLYLGNPTCSTNVSGCSTRSLYANGGILTQGNITAQNGAFLTGTTQINTNNGAATTEICDGTTTGQCNVGGSGGALVLGGTVTVTNISTDATHTDATLCEDTTTHRVFFGSGTIGACLGTSSARFKHDIASLGAGLAEVMALQPVQYYLNGDHGDPDKLLYGFTAEQGETALPKLVGRDAEDKPNTFDYLGVVPVLVRAMQQQQAEIDALKNRWCIGKWCW